MRIVVENGAVADSGFREGVMLAGEEDQTKSGRAVTGDRCRSREAACMIVYIPTCSGPPRDHTDASVGRSVVLASPHRRPRAAQAR